MAPYFGNSVPIYLWESTSLPPPWKEDIQLRPGRSESGITQGWVCDPKWVNQTVMVEIWGKRNSLSLGSASVWDMSLELLDAISVTIWVQPAWGWGQNQGKQRWATERFPMILSEFLDPAEPETISTSKLLPSFHTETPITCRVSHLILFQSLWYCGHFFPSLFIPWATVWITSIIVSTCVLIFSYATFNVLLFNMLRICWICCLICKPIQWILHFRYCIFPF